MRTTLFGVRLRFALVFVLAFSTAACLVQPAVPVANAAVTISKSSYYDKTLAGILGQVTGVLTGYEFVQKDSLPDSWFDTAPGAHNLTYGPYSGDNTHWSNTTYPGYDRLFSDGRVGGDDDYHIDFFNQLILDNYGPNVTYQDIKNEWTAHQVGDWGAGDEAMKRMNEGMLPPQAGKAEFNRFYWVTEAYIETETLGMVAPGMPNTARDLTHRFGSVLSDYDALIWGKYLATAYSLAYFQSDARTVVDLAAPALPVNSWPYQIYTRAKQLYAEKPNDWRWAAAEIKKMGRAHYQSDNDMALGDINNGLFVLAILYGNNDYMTTAQVASLVGYDADCTASSALGLMGIIKGMAGTPQAIKDRIYANGNGVYVNDLTTGFPPRINQNYPAEQKWTDLAALYQRNAEDFIVASGGSIGTSDYTINNQTLTSEAVVPVSNYDFEQGSLAGWTSTNASHAQAGSPAQSGAWAGKLTTDASANDVKLYTTLKGLDTGATYRVSAFVRTDTLARLYADNYGGISVYADVLNSAANTNYEWANRSIEFTVTGTTATVGLHMPPGTAGQATIDNLVVQKISSPSKTRYEAESAARSGGQVRSGTSASNGSYLGGLDTTGNSVQFAVNAPSAGEYRVAVNYANNWSAISKLDLYVNGASTANATVSFPRTGAWGTFSRNIVEVPVKLAAGSNTIKLQHNATGYVELDYIDLSPYPANVAGSSPRATNNLIQNAGFEDGGASQAIHGWGTWAGSNGTNADADFVETNGQTGSLRLTHYKASAYEVFTDQTITNVPNGTYTLRAWVVSGGGQNSAYMSAKNYGSSAPELTANVPGNGWPNWSQITISNISVTNGQITVGFYSNAPAGKWMSADNVELVRQ